MTDLSVGTKQYLADTSGQRRPVALYQRSESPHRYPAGSVSPSVSPTLSSPLLRVHSDGTGSNCPPMLEITRLTRGTAFSPVPANLQPCSRHHATFAHRGTVYAAVKGISGAARGTARLPERQTASHQVPSPPALCILLSAFQVLPPPPSEMPGLAPAATSTSDNLRLCTKDVYRARARALDLALACSLICSARSLSISGHQLLHCVRILRFPRAWNLSARHPPYDPSSPLPSTCLVALGASLVTISRIPLLAGSCCALLCSTLLCMIC
ncbi:hypothetical protein TgHK011_009072 [Trichoderma gracile]|nr:hypothetical protein TgHK011_009072 [Trichoderma gracile]